MLLSLVYFVMRCLLQALARSGRVDFEQEVELLVLRHQLKVISRNARRPPFRRRDRMLLAAASRILSKDRWKSFVVTLELCSGGTANSFAASGRIAAPGRAGQDSIPKRWSSSLGWRKRTPGGGT
jgi:hypothetical protein